MSGSMTIVGPLPSIDFDFEDEDVSLLLSSVAMSCSGVM